MIELLFVAEFLRIIDGDTFILRGERIRIENIDAPELHGQCLWESELAQISRDILGFILSQPFHVHRTGRDRYGRTLARVTMGGRDVGEALVGAKLAVPWDARKRAEWCP